MHVFWLYANRARFREDKQLTGRGSAKYQKPHSRLETSRSRLAFTRRSSRTQGEENSSLELRKVRYTYLPGFLGSASEGYDQEIERRPVQ